MSTRNASSFGMNAYLKLIESDTAVVSDQLSVGGNTVIAGALSSNTIAISSTDEASIIASGGISIAKSVTVGGNTTIQGAAQVLQGLTILGTADASDASQGALHVIGGISVGGTIYANKSIHVLDKLFVNASSQFTGPVVFDSPVSIASAITEPFTVVGGIKIGNDSTFDAKVLILSTAPDSITTHGGLIVSKDIQVVGNVTASGITITSTLDSTSMSTGALIIHGGLAVQKNTSLHTVHVSSTLNSTNVTTGALTVLGGIGISKSVNVGDTVFCLSTLDAVDVSSGSIVVSGGMGIAKTLRTHTLHVHATTTSTGTSTGALVVQGGCGIQGTCHVQDAVVVLSTTAATSLGHGALISQGGASVNGALYVGQHIVSDTFVSVGTHLTVQGQTEAHGIFTLHNTTPSTSTANGAMIVAGGIGIQGASTFGNTVHFLSTIDSVGIGSGTLVIDGGMSVAKQLYANSMFSNGSAVVTVDMLIDYQAGVNLRLDNGVFSVIDNPTFTQRVTLLSTEAASNITTGSLVTHGGIGVALESYFGASVYIRGTADTALSVQGGMVAIGNVSGSLLRATSLDSAVPVLGQQSAGTRLRFGSVNDALGVSGNGVWMNSATHFDWYSGGTQIMSLTSQGSLSCQTLTTSSTMDATSTITGGIICAGGMGVAKNMHVGGSVHVQDVRLRGTNGLKVGIKASSATSTYEITVPPALPNTTSFVTADSFGNLGFASLLTGGNVAFYHNGVAQSGVKVWTTTVTVGEAGMVYVHVTHNGLANGTPVFNTIFHVSGMASSFSEVPYQIAIVGMRDISEDLRTVTFVVVTGLNQSQSGKTHQPAMIGTPVMVLVIGT